MRVSKYILKIAMRSEPPGAQENLRLWKATREAGDRTAAINEMVCRNLLLIVRVAEEFGDNGPLSPDDLVQEGAILMATVYIPKYDPDRPKSASFKVFAARALRRDFVKTVSRNGSFGLALPVGHLTKMARLRRSGDASRAEELQRKTSSISVEEADMGAPCYTSPEAEAEMSEMTYRLRLAMDELTARERDIVMARFGLSPYIEPETLAHIGKRWGVDKERIRQIECHALRKLYADLGSLE